MASKKKQLKALGALNLDLFESRPMITPAPATLHTKIREHAQRQVQVLPDPAPEPKPGDPLPSIAELYRRFDMYNWMYFQGKLPRPRIEYSSRMSSAGSYTPHGRIIKIGRKYHELFPQDIDDTLKHEMIHIIHFYHDAAFKREAKRIGASLKARSHPALQRPPKYLYQCPGCRREYPRQKQIRLASCGYCSRGGKFDNSYKLRLIDSPGLKRSRQKSID